MVHLNFTPFPILKTNRLALRLLSIEDQQVIFALRSSNEINKYLDRAPSKTVDDAILFINKVHENLKNNNAIYWGISQTNSGKIIGTICLFDFSNDLKSCEIGYELLSAFQKQGIMKEAAQVVINYAFQTVKVKKIIAYTHQENSNSTHLLLQLHFIKSVETVKDNPNLHMYTLSQ